MFMRVTSRHGVDVNPDPCKREACSMTLRIYSLGEPGDREINIQIYFTGGVVHIYIYNYI